MLSKKISVLALALYLSSMGQSAFAYSPTDVAILGIMLTVTGVMTIEEIRVNRQDAHLMATMQELAPDAARFRATGGSELSPLLQAFFVDVRRSLVAHNQNQSDPSDSELAQAIINLAGDTNSDI